LDFFLFPKNIPFAKRVIIPRTKHYCKLKTLSEIQLCL
jgi:hypothetical protein